MLITQGCFNVKTATVRPWPPNIRKTKRNKSTLPPGVCKYNDWETQSKNYPSPSLNKLGMCLAVWACRHRQIIQEWEIERHKDYSRQFQENR